ncbi:aminodeoxychorismate/anthranilate synthase component II [uncultured Sphingomonas sp.]|nr:aminodeoxychorismate/anthranilate synthase component II [uncultured Sphingomonas sp.]
MPSILVLDNQDSFTFTLVDYLTTLSAKVRVVRSDQVTLAEVLNSPFDGFLISPGPGRPDAAGISVELSAACIAEARPLLGVCLGHQAIGLAVGAEVEQVPPVHGKTCAVTHDESGLFARLPSPLNATRYHSLAVTAYPSALRPNAWAADGTVQGFRHAHAPVHGVQFHPESVASQHGHALLRNFLDLCS